MSDAAPAAAAGEAPADAREARPAPVVAAIARPKKKAKAHWSGVDPGEAFEVTVEPTAALARHEHVFEPTQMCRPAA